MATFALIALVAFAVFCLFLIFQPSIAKIPAGYIVWYNGIKGWRKWFFIWKH